MPPELDAWFVIDYLQTNKKAEAPCLCSLRRVGVDRQRYPTVGTSTCRGSEEYLEANELMRVRSNIRSIRILRSAQL